MTKPNTDDTSREELEMKPTKYDWSTPRDGWLIPILNRYRYGGAIECRAIPSEIQILIDKHTKTMCDMARLDELNRIGGLVLSNYEKRIAELQSTIKTNQSI